MDSRYFVTLTELLAGDDHPVRKVEHGFCEQSGMVDTGPESASLHADELYFCAYLFPVIFSCFFVIPGVHMCSFGSTDQERPNKKACTALSVFSMRSSLSI